MADGMRLEVEGLGKLVSTMRKAGIDMSDLKQANKKAGTIVANAGRAVAPRRTGRLAASIKPANQARRARIRAGGGGVRHARFQEFGTRKNRATHYLYGSAAKTRGEWLPAYEWELNIILSRIQGA